MASVRQTGNKYSDDQIAIVLQACIDVAVERTTQRSAIRHIEIQVPSYPIKNFDGELRRVSLYLTGKGRFGFKFPANWARVFINITNDDTKVIAAFREQQRLYKERTGKNSGVLEEILSNYPSSTLA